MKKKIIGIFVCVLLVSIVVFPAFGTTKMDISIPEDNIINLNNYEKLNDREWAFCWINNYINADDLWKCDDEYILVTGRLHNKGNYEQYHQCSNYKSASHWNYKWDDGNIDPADIAIFRGHGSTGTDTYYDKKLKGPLWREDSDNVRLTAGENNNNRHPGHGYGNRDLEWIAFGCCAALEDDVYGSLWKWDNTFNGLHQMLGYKTNSAHEKYAYEWIFQCTKSSPHRVAWSWFKACDEKQPSGVIAVAMAETNSMFYDYLHGFKDGAKDDPTPDDTQWAWFHTKNGAIQIPSKVVEGLPQSMVVYKVLPKNITTEDVENLGMIFGLSGSVTIDESNYCLDNESLSLQVNQIEGIDYSDDAKLWIPTEESPNLPSLRDAEVIATDFLNSHNLLPSDAAPQPTTNYSDILKEIDINKDIVLKEFPVAISVAYNRKLNGYPVVGPGGCCLVYITDKKELTGITKIWRDVAEEGIVSLISQDTALDLLDTYGMKVVLNGLPVFDTHRIKDVSVGYYESGFGEYQSYLIPVYIFSIDFYVDGEYDSSDVIYIPAAEQFIPPIAKIVSPSDGIKIPYGSTIEFRGSASYGNPPYMFRWESDIDGMIGTSQDISISNLSVCIEEGDFRPHTVKLIVTDQYGMETADMITVTILSDNNPPFTPSISGRAKGKTGTEYKFSIVSTDPDGDQISYYINLLDGEDGGVNEWFGPFPSGNSVTMKYTWKEKGEYLIYTQAKDVHNATSKFSEPFIITMPRSRTINNQFWEFLENHPNIFPLLQKILNWLGQ